jgi:hypothetical protein
MTSRRTFVVALTIVFTSLALVRAADINGKWTAKFMTQVGDQEYTFDFVVKGSTLTGTAKSNLIGDSKLTEGKVEGDKVSFVEVGKYMDMELRIEYTGTVTSNDEIKFTRKIADFASEDLIAKRSK